MKKLRVKLFTHTDLDGVGCVAVAKDCFHKVDYELTNYNDVDEKVDRFIDNNEQIHYDLVYMTDISPSTREKAEKFLSCGKSVIIDHHETKLFLSDIDGICVRPDIDGRPTSGTYLFKEFLENLLDYEPNGCMQDFVRDVDLWDTWLWKEEPEEGQTRVKKLNMILGILGSSMFLEHIEHMVLTYDEENPEPVRRFNKIVEELYKRELGRQKYAMIQSEKSMIIKEHCGRKIGFVMSNNYVSELGEFLLSKYPVLDFVTIIGSGSISFRSIRQNNVSKVAETLGGGGHFNAAGAKLTEDVLSRFFDSVFEGTVI